MSEKRNTSLLQDVDRDFFERELSSFVPQRVFDAHAHIWPEPLCIDSLPPMPDAVDIPYYRQMLGDLLPERELRSLLIPFPRGRETIPAANQWVADQIHQSPKDRGLFLIHPEDDPEFVRQEARGMGMVGFKCYHVFAPPRSKDRSRPTWEADIPEYLPEAFARIAHEEGWVILLHMVKPRSVADPSNQHWIRHYCEKYPNMRLILAHSARAFQPSHALEGLESLLGLDNLYFDCSANCEPVAHQAVLRFLGPKKMMFGADFPICHQRGRCVGVGDSFLWLSDDSSIWKERHQKVQPVLVGLEAIRSLKYACWAEKLSDADVEMIFYGVAAELLS